MAAYKKNGIVLTDRDAEAIYRCKIQLIVPDTFKSSLLSVESRTRGQSVQIAERFGVSAKTIRDIWSRRTWAYATAHLWSDCEADSSILVSMIPVSKHNFSLETVIFEQQTMNKNSRVKEHRILIFVKDFRLSERKKICHPT